MDEEKIIAYITGNITDESEKAEVRNRINEDHATKQLFIRLKNIYALSRKSSGLTDVDREYLKLQRKTGTRIKRLITGFLKYAAVVIITIGLTWLTSSRYWNQTETTQMNEVICPPGQISELVLSDGSHVWLNAGSSLSYPSRFSKQQRSVLLRGEAFFEVTKNSKSPFLVKTRTMNIKVLGTSFNVDAYDETQIIKITLVEGKVEIQNATGDKLAEMFPGQLAGYDITSGKINLLKVDTRFYSSWKEGKMTFFDESLEVIADKLERWYNVKITFADNDLKSLRFSGTFLKYKPLEQILQIIRLSAPIDYQITINPESKNEIMLVKLK